VMRDEVVGPFHRRIDRKRCHGTAIHPHLLIPINIGQTLTTSPAENML
jgi:hypothetical protein